MSTWSLLIITAGVMTVDGPRVQAADRSAEAAPASCAPLTSDSEITLLTFSSRDGQESIQQASYSQACAAPVCSAPPACTPVSCAAAALPGCGNTYGNGYTTYCGTCPCEEQSCCDRCRNRCAWHRAHTTGDMYPHYGYYPEHHGYYYFRPYNWMHVLEHQSRVIGMGGDTRNPYSVAMFDAVYEDFEQRFPQIIDPPAGSVQPLGSHLPNLEDLLNDR